MDALLKKHRPPISASLLFWGIFAVHISHGNIEKYTQVFETKVAQRIRFLPKPASVRINSDLEADIIRPIEKKKAFNDVHCASSLN
jgi:hypothetical protein